MDNKIIYGVNSTKVTDSKYHYAYRITNTVLKKHYYGVRSSKNHPFDDLGSRYLSSSLDKDFIQDQKDNPQNYKYKVVKIFEDRNLAVGFEIYLHNKFNVGINPAFYNKVKQTSINFNPYGKAAAICPITGESVGLQDITDERWNNGTFISPAKNKANSYCAITGKFVGLFHKDDEIWNSGQVVGYNRNKCLGKNPITHEYIGLFDLDDEIWNSGEVVPFNSGLCTAYCAFSGECLGLISTDDPRWKTGEIVGRNSIHCVISDGSNSRTYIPDGTDRIPNGWHISTFRRNKSVKLVNIYDKDTMELLYSNVVAKLFAQTFGHNQSKVSKCARLNALGDGKVYVYKDFVVKYSDINTP